MASCLKLTYIDTTQPTGKLKYNIDTTVSNASKIGKVTMLNQFYEVFNKKTTSQQNGSAPLRNNAKTPLPSLSLPLNITELRTDILKIILEKASRMNYNTNLVNTCFQENGPPIEIAKIFFLINVYFIQ